MSPDDTLTEQLFLFYEALFPGARRRRTAGSGPRDEPKRTVVSAPWPGRERSFAWPLATRSMLEFDLA